MTFNHFVRLENLNRSRQLLVEYRNVYTVEKVQASVSKLKTFKPDYLGKFMQSSFQNR